MYLYLDRALRVGPHRRPHSGVLLLAMIRAARPGGQLHSCFSGPQGVADLRSRPGLQLTSEQAMGVAYFPLNFPPGTFHPPNLQHVYDIGPALLLLLFERRKLASSNLTVTTVSMVEYSGLLPRLGKCSTRYTSTVRELVRGMSRERMPASQASNLLTSAAETMKIVFSRPRSSL